MSIKEQILNDIKDAMKSKNTFKRDTLRLITSVLKQVEVDERIELNNERIFAILQTEIKKRNDAIEQYKKANRDELVQKEQEEIDVICTYLPKQLNDDELDFKMKEFAKNLNACDMKDLGKLIAHARANLGASADGKRISQSAKKILE